MKDLSQIDQRYCKYNIKGVFSLRTQSWMNVNSWFILYVSKQNKIEISMSWTCIKFIQKEIKLNWKLNTDSMVW